MPVVQSSEFNSGNCTAREEIDEMWMKCKWQIRRTKWNMWNLHLDHIYRWQNDVNSVLKRRWTHLWEKKKRKRKKLDIDWLINWLLRRKTQNKVAKLPANDAHTVYVIHTHTHTHTTRAAWVVDDDGIDPPYDVYAEFDNKKWRKKQKIY